MIKLKLCSELCPEPVEQQLCHLQVVQVKTPEREGYLSLQLGCGSKREKQLNGRYFKDISHLSDNFCVKFCSACSGMLKTPMAQAQEASPTNMLEQCCRQLGHYAWAGVPIKRKLSEFRITDDAYLPVGTALNAAHFVPGQYVDIQGSHSQHNSMLARYTLLQIA